MLSDLGEDGEVVFVSAEAAARARSTAERLASDLGDTAEDPCGSAAVLVSALPAELVRAVHRYGNAGSPHDVLLVRGLLPHMGGLEATPGTATPSALGQDGQVAELLLLAVLSLLGEPFTFASLYEGRLIQHVTAVPGREDTQTSEGSQATLDWHVEDAFSADRCDYFGLLCLRGAADVVTRVAAARYVRLPAAVGQVLRQPRFAIQPDEAHQARPADLPPTSVLSGPAQAPEICFDGVYQQPADPGDGEAAAALQALADEIDRVAVGLVLEPGDLLLIDNRRVVHARTGYQPRYDGTGRWVLRTMVCASRREHRRRGGVRVLPAPSQM